MNRLPVIMAILLIAGSVHAEDTSLAERLFEPNDVTQSLAKSGLTPTGSPASDAVKNPEDINPGKALMLSAIMPGAGQYSLGQNLKAIGFFALEIAAWTGVIHYYNQGKNKEEEFEKYADTHFEEQIYRTIEFDLARSPQWGDSGAFVGEEQEWIDRKWDEKIHYLPNQGFTHEMPTREERSVNKSHQQQYYEMIGKYIRQFGFGWDDNFGDDPGTPWFDGRSPNSEHYMDIRYESNQMLDRSALAIQIAMLNHVASALEASFSARLMKRRAKAKVGFRQIEYNDRPVAVGGLNIQW